MSAAGSSPSRGGAKRGRADQSESTNTPKHSTLEPVRALEFYCGVGGLHYSLRRARPFGGARVVGAFDINPNACDVYEKNFGTRPIQNSLSAVSSKKLDTFEASLWLMSPPCQPFTRQGAQRDAEDARADSFLSLLQLVPRLRRKPTHVLVENVVGFETSETRDVLLRTLTQNGFDAREFILSPRMFGVPYSRPRYFCVAKTKGLRWADAEKVQSKSKSERYPRDVSEDRWPAVRRFPPRSYLSHPKHWVPRGYEDDLEPAEPTEATVPRARRERGQTPAAAAAAAKARHAAALGDRSASPGATTETYGVAPLRGFLEPEIDEPEPFSEDGASRSAWAEHEVPLAELRKARLSVDAVLAGDRKCNCFTKSYGKFTKGTGSFVAETRFDFKAWEPSCEPSSEREPSTTTRELAASRDVSDEKTTPSKNKTKTRPPRTRYFSPREVANIHSFPATFAFPERTTKTQRFALLGNSLSVACVAPLLEYLLNDSEDEKQGEVG